jgi:hypothetical protein
MKLEIPVFMKNLNATIHWNNYMIYLYSITKVIYQFAAVAHRLISAQVKVFDVLVYNDLHRYKETCGAASLETFNGVEVRVLGATSGKEKLISRRQFYEALSDAMKVRMHPSLIIICVIHLHWLIRVLGRLMG